MYLVKTTIEGISPILFNRFTEEAQGNMEAGRNVGRQTVAKKREEAKTQKIYKNKDGLFCPAQNLKKAMVLACSVAGLKRQRKSLGAILKAIMFIEPVEVAFGVKEPDYIDEQSGRIPPRTGARVVLYRPALKDGWRLSFAIRVFDDLIDKDQIQAALTAAGIYQGLCDGRPEYGRFKVVSFEEAK